MFTSLEWPCNRVDIPGFYVSWVSGDLDAYERLGDRGSPFEVSAKDARRQQERQCLRDSMRCDVAPLTFEQYRARVAEPCMWSPVRGWGAVRL
jgi:hypothetical protein